MKQFTCKKCSGVTVEEVLSGVTLISNITDVELTDKGDLAIDYGDHVTEGGDVDSIYYQCATCGEPVDTDDLASLIDDQDRKKEVQTEMNALFDKWFDSLGDVYDNTTTTMEIVDEALIQMKEGRDNESKEFDEAKHENMNLDTGIGAAIGKAISNGQKPAEIFRKHTKTIPCEDCMNDIPVADIIPWKYEPSIKLCPDCFDQRMEEE